MLMIETMIKLNFHQNHQNAKDILKLVPMNFYDFDVCIFIF